MKSPRFCMALFGILAVAGMTHAGSPELSMLLLPLAFGQEPVPSVQPETSPELLPPPRPVSPPQAARPQAVSVPDGGTVVIGARVFETHPCTGDKACCAKAGSGCAECAKPAVGEPAKACDNSCLAAAKPCKCCENCEDCKDCTCAKAKTVATPSLPVHVSVGVGSSGNLFSRQMTWLQTNAAVKPCKCCESCEDCKDCTCGKKKTAVIRIQGGFNSDHGLVGGLIINERNFDVSRCTGCGESVRVQMSITPKILADGRVLMRINPEASSVVPTPVQLGNGQLGTAINIQRSETTVLADDGQTIVLGGMIEKKDGSCGTKKLLWVLPRPPVVRDFPSSNINGSELGLAYVPQPAPIPPYYLMQLAGKAITPIIVSQQPPVAHDFRCQPPLAPADELADLVRERELILAAKCEIDKQLMQLAWQQKVGQCQPAVAVAHTTPKAHLVTKHFEAHCDMIRCVGDDPNTLILEGNVRLSCKAAGARIEASRVVVNITSGAFTVQSLSTAVPPPVPLSPTTAPVRPTSLTPGGSYCPVAPPPTLPQAPAPSPPLYVPSPYFNW